MRAMTGIAAALIGLMSFLGSSAMADDARGEIVHFKGGAGPIKGYLAKPKGDGPFPAVIVIHEWYGLTDWIESNARELADQGYVALAVDLYGGRVAKDNDTAHELMRALNQNEAVADLTGGVAYLKGLKFVDTKKPFGAIGWCMGGGYARELAQASPAVGPTVICYGSVTTDPAQVAKLKGKPILCIFGENEKGIPLDKVKEFTAALMKLGNSVGFMLYPAAGHGFMRPGPAHNAAATKDARVQIEKFFASHLKGK